MVVGSKWEAAVLPAAGEWPDTDTVDMLPLS